MTNAFNLLDNVDGLAAVLAAIASLFFAIDAATLHPNRGVLIIALALFNACLAFLPFNIRRAGSARVFMGDSGSQVLGFALAACGIAATLKVAQTTVATLLLPLLVLAVPILDTTLVTIVRLFEGRPIYQGGRDHTSHRLVYHGLSDRRAVILLATMSAALGSTSLAYGVIDDPKITVIGVLLTFALVVQFASFLADVDRSPDAVPEQRPGLLRDVIIHRGRFVEVVVDAVVVGVSLYGAYVLRLGSNDTPSQQKYLIAMLPVLLFARYLAFIPFGLYRGVWRYVDARDAGRVAVFSSWAPGGAGGASRASCARRRASGSSGSSTTTRGSGTGGCSAFPCSAAPTRCSGSSRKPAPTSSSWRFRTRRASGWTSCARRAPGPASSATSCDARSSRRRFRSIPNRRRM